MQLAPLHSRLDVSGDKTLYWFGDNNHTEWAAHFDEYRPGPGGRGGSRSICSSIHSITTSFVACIRSLNL